MLALIIGGSIAKGLEREDSDVDAVIVLTDEEAERRHAARDYCFYSEDLTDYPGGYVDAKLVDLCFLRDVAERGSDPARSAFEGAWVDYSEIAGLDGLLARIPVYPESDHQNRLEAFCGQMVAMQWFVGEAERHDNRYLLMHAASDLVLFASRLLLAHNRMLYPYHKWLLAYVRKAPDKPARFFEHVDALLASPSSSNANALVDCVQEFGQWGFGPLVWVPRFFEDVEWSWRRGKPGIEDW